jgi:hypothetical protein
MILILSRCAKATRSIQPLKQFTNIGKSTKINISGKSNRTTWPTSLAS